MSRIPLDVTQTLYDTDGYRHTLVRATPAQILTLVEGFYWLWDRRSGRCLIEGVGSNRLSNSRPPGEDLRAAPDPVAETRAFFLAQKAVRCAAASATAVLVRPLDEPVQPRRAQSDAFAPVTLPALTAESNGASVPTRGRAAPTARPALLAAVMVGFAALGLLLGPDNPREPGPSAHRD
jgi:hypothetical protein